MTKRYELYSDDLMTAAEASKRWGFDEGYVRQQLLKYPGKFLKNTIRKFGKTYIITREGMEYITGMTEREANAGLWKVRHEKNWMVDFEQRVDSEEEARNLIALKATEELEQLNITFSFDKIDKEKYLLRVRENSIYTYEKLKK